MNPWLETIAVTIVTLAGIFMGKAFSRLRKPYWTLGYFPPLLLIAMLALVRFNNALSFVPLLSWIALGRAKFVVLSLAVTIGLTTPLSRLPRKSEKLITCILMTIVVVWFSILPLLVPALIKERLLRLPTLLDADGVCFQSTDYTCGPAAAVTALRKLGFRAHEGEIAVLAHTSPIAGTLPRSLYTAIQDRYGPSGLNCQYQHFDSLDQLKDAPIILAVVSHAFLWDHCVAVLEVSDRMVTIADPVVGRMSMSRENFEKIWRFSGIVLKRDSAQSI